MNCEICDEFLDGSTNSFRLLVPKEELLSRTIKETQNFRALAGLGSIIPGYVLIFSKRHIPNMGQLSIDELNELERIIKVIRLEIEQRFTIKTVVFEHGDGGILNYSGACINHAHIHICPTTIDFQPDASNFISQINEITHLTELLNWGQVEGGYLFYESLEGKKFVYKLQNKLPSQFMRRCWATSLSVPERWDWAIFPYVSNVILTVKLLTNS